MFIFPHVTWFADQLPNHRESSHTVEVIVYKVSFIGLMSGHSYCAISGYFKKITQCIRDQFVWSWWIALICDWLSPSTSSYSLLRGLICFLVMISLTVTVEWNQGLSSKLTCLETKKCELLCPQSYPRKLHSQNCSEVGCSRSIAVYSQSLIMSYKLCNSVVVRLNSSEYVDFVFYWAQSLRRKIRSFMWISWNHFRHLIMFSILSVLHRMWLCTQRS